MKKNNSFKASLLFGLLLFCSFSVWAQGDQSRKQLFDYDWKFFLGDTATASQKGFKDASWRSLDLPHDWSIEGKILPKNPTKGAGGYFPAGVGWYRKTFHVPAEWKAKSVSVYIEGVYMNSEVFINGKSLGVHPYGYSSFIYDLSPYLDFGKENVIAVRVDNSKYLNSRWYSGSGIYRHVWLQLTDAVHVPHWGVVVSTPEVSFKKAVVEVKTTVKNETSNPKDITIKTVLWNKAGKIAGCSSVKAALPAKGQKEVAQIVQLANPQLWSPEKPDLYQAQIQLISGGKIIDDSKTTFGIRSLKFSPEHGFQLNGKTIKLNGGCVHHENGCLGSAAYDRAEERKVELLKAGGFNAVRTSHNMPSEAFLEACDRLGLLVMDESFDCWAIGKNQNDYSVHFNQWWERDLQAMVLRDRNHPSIFMWSIGNEIPERGKPEAVKTAAMLIDALKKMDNTRPVTSAIVENGKDWTIMDSLMAVHDVAGYNYHLFAAPTDHQRVPSRMIVQTESYPKDAFVNWKLVRDNSYVLGDFVWTAIDYLGESGIGRYYYSGEVPGENWDNDMFPIHAAYCGDIDLMGWRKPISHYRSMLYNDKQKLYMAVREPAPEPLEIKETWWSVYPTWESWTWPGFEGRQIEVEIYSKYPKVKLYLNNEQIGEKPSNENTQFKATFPIPYKAGTLKAVGYENEKAVEEFVIKTSGEAAKIKLSADKPSLVANGQDLCFVNVEFTDKEGTVQPNAINLLQFEIEGEGIIVGVDNANIRDTAPYVSNMRKAWKGKALVVIKTKRAAGDIKLRVSSDGLPSTVLSLKSHE